MNPVEEKESPVEKYRSDHETEYFDCGDESINLFLKKNALVNQKRGVSQIFCLSEDVVGSGKSVIGYYTLSASSIPADGVDQEKVKGIPRGYAAPVILLGRLGVDKRHQRKGIGERLLLDALERAMHIASNDLGAVGVVLDALNAEVASWYADYGFIVLEENKLFIPMKAIKSLMK